MNLEAEIQEPLFVAEGKAIEQVLRRAVHHALLIHKRAGNPVAAWKDGRVVLLRPEQILVDEPIDSH